MSAPRKFDEETRARAVRMYLDRLAQGDSKLQARRHIGVLLDINPATIRNWIEAQERVDEARPPAPAGDTSSSRNSNAGSLSSSGRMRFSRPRARFSQGRS